jgi:exodeoxyribonuclease VII small subunit
MKKNQPTESNSTPPSFEKALAELESIIQNLETGQLPLQDIITAYERGRQLASICQNHLKDAELKIERIAQDLPPLPHENKASFN